MEREDVMRRIRLEIDRPGHKDGLKKNKAAQLLGISRQRVTQLYAAWNKRRTPKMETPKPPPVQPETAPQPTPKDINDVLAPLGPAPVPEPAKPAPVPGPDDVVFKKIDEPAPSPVDGERPDPEDAAAGRDLVKWFVRGFKEGLCRLVFKMKRDDPRMAEIREDNEFLKIAIKRNSEKAAPLGKLTKGPWGLFIGTVIESVKMAFVIGDDGGDVPVTPHKEVKRADAPAPDVATDAPRKPMSMDDKINAANKAKL